MNIKEALIKLRDDIKLWVTNNLRSLASKKVDKSGDTITGDLEVQGGINATEVISQELYATNVYAGTEGRRAQVTPSGFSVTDPDDTTTYRRDGITYKVIGSLVGESQNQTYNLRYPYKGGTLATTDDISTYTHPDTHPAEMITGLADVATSGDYNDLDNKPTIPTVNNGTLTIQKNSTNVAIFSSNQSENVTADITVPTKISELTNDSGYLTSLSARDGTYDTIYGTNEITFSNDFEQTTAHLVFPSKSGTFALLSDISSGDSSVTVDSALSDTSENPVQNKVIKSALDGKLSTSGSTARDLKVIDNLHFVSRSYEDGGTYLVDESESETDPVLGFYGMAGDDEVRLANIANPQSDGDAANKKYVDNKVGGAIGVVNLGDFNFAQASNQCSASISTDGTLTRANVVSIAGTLQVTIGSSTKNFYFTYFPDSNNTAPTAFFTNVYNSSGTPGMCSFTVKPLYAGSTMYLYITGASAFTLSSGSFVSTTATVKSISGLTIMYIR